MQIGQAHLLIGDQPQAIVYLLGEIWCLKKVRNKVVSKCSAESENRAKADLTYDLIWVKDLLTKLGFTLKSPNDVLIQPSFYSHC